MPLSERFAMTYEQLLASYGEFARFAADVRIDTGKVPDQFHALLPYARFWGIKDDGYRQDAIDAAPEWVLRDLDRLVSEYVGPLGDWLAAEADSPLSMTPEYLSLTCLVLVFDRA